MASSFTQDDGKAIAELERLGNPGFELAGLLESQIHTMFNDTQSIVHVVTGSLRGSGAVETRWLPDNIWEGEITYGGDSPGFPHNPVTYADQERGRGGEHDFFRTMPEESARIEVVISEFLHG